jgi:DNA processing protein
LAEQILQADGALITEFAPGSKPLPAYFRQRNLIISDLSLGILVVEAAVKSGSLITARFAMEQDR